MIVVFLLGPPLVTNFTLPAVFGGLQSAKFPFFITNRVLKCTYGVVLTTPITNLKNIDKDKERRKFLLLAKNHTKTPYFLPRKLIRPTVDLFIPIGRMGEDVQIGHPRTHSDATMLPDSPDAEEQSVRVMCIHSDIKTPETLPELRARLSPELISNEVWHTCKIKPGKTEEMDVVFRFGLTHIGVTLKNKSGEKEFPHPVVFGT